MNVSISSATWRLNSRHIGSNDYAHLAGAKRLLKRDERKILTMIESVIYDRKLGSLPILDCLKIGNILVNRFIRIERIAFSLSLSRARILRHQKEKDKEGSSCGRNGDVIGGKVGGVFCV